MSTQIARTPVESKDWSPLVGKCFLNPWLDYLLIGAGLSLPFLCWVMIDPSITPTDLKTKTMVYLFLNYAHFASSTVRLYTKPGEIPNRWMVSYGLPIVALLVTTLCIAWPKLLGDHLWALFITWSPYHYAMQAYGLALMYCYRSGVYMDTTEKRMFWGIAMLPFIRAILESNEGGLTWFKTVTGLNYIPYIPQLTVVLSVLIFALPIIVFFRLRDKGKTLPLIAWLMLFVNGIWWVTASYGVAWFWATIFHSIQYIVIVVIFHVNDQMKLPGNKRKPMFHSLWFYVISFLLGYFLFQIWPFLYLPFGFEMEAAVLMTVATVNLHHFIVDGYIWRSGKKKKSSS
ncbi:MAG: hypothetical protein AAF939_04400 [Planctomycetota bacterium]